MAVKAGTAIITATAADGSRLEAQCTVTVRKKSSGGGSPSYYFVTFDTNGGDDMDKLIKLEETEIDIDDYIPEKEGYEFVGWYLDEDFEEKAEDMKLTGDVTLYAKWEKIDEEEKEDTEEIEDTENTENTEIYFSDVSQNDWFYEAVCYCAENGIMSGVGDSIFAPNAPFTREMLAVVIYNAEGRPEVDGRSPFADVEQGAWYTDAIIWANKNGIVAGYGDGTYGVGEAITREQFASILYRYGQYKGYDVSVGEDTNILSYLDAFDISGYAFPAMQWACAEGILSGMGDDTILPQGTATRAQAAQMLMSFCENIK